jgi:inosine/xanthosine triphosphate pyrophosphatase family protein/diadenosine tetraphosphate (Ap4A) HIT family hydrolase
MLLLTSNPRKYGPLADILAKMQISLRKPDIDLPELQSLDFDAVVAGKAKMAAESLGRPCLVDDAGLLLDAYPGFPGPVTGTVLHSLGAAGIERLLSGVSDRARMVCHIGCWIDDRLWRWQGEVAGHLDPRRPVTDGPGPLAQWFVADEPGGSDGYLHRRRALAALGGDIDSLRRRVGAESAGDSNSLATCHRECVFCQEFDGSGRSIYHEMLGRDLPSRIIHRTEHFVVFPPLGQFIEGGLLLATRDHRISMATLPDAYYADLDRLMTETCDLLAEHYGSRPLFFEHAPAAPGDKGTCCVDHAHLNVFPARVDVHAQLRKFPHVEIGSMRNLSASWLRNQPYLFLQTNEGQRYVYDAGIVPSQYIRRIVTRALGMVDRWHWREYLGLEELKRTYGALSGWRHSHAPMP